MNPRVQLPQGKHFQPTRSSVDQLRGQCSISTWALDPASVGIKIPLRYPLATNGESRSTSGFSNPPVGWDLVLNILRPASPLLSDRPTPDPSIARGARGSDQTRRVRTCFRFGFNLSGVEGTLVHLLVLPRRSIAHGNISKPPQWPCTQSSLATGSPLPRQRQVPDPTAMGAGALHEPAGAVEVAVG